MPSGSFLRKRNAHGHSGLKSKGRICDVGANVGNHAIFFATVCNSTHCYAVDPSADIFANLLRNIRLNELSDTITPLPFGAGDFHGHIDITCHGERKRIQVKRLEDLQLKRPCALIKVDVKGMESEAL